MQSKELIKKIIAEVLFNVQADKLPPCWQHKVNKAGSELYVQVFKPLKMINSLLLDSEEKLKKENLHLQHEKSKLLHLIGKLQSQQGTNCKEEKL
jgi:hypothetical protein